MRARHFLAAVSTAAYVLLPAPVYADGLCIGLTVSAGGQTREVPSECVPFDGTVCHVEGAGVGSISVWVSFCAPDT